MVICDSSSRFFKLTLPWPCSYLLDRPTFACIAFSPLHFVLCPRCTFYLVCIILVRGSNHHLYTENGYIYIPSPYFLLSSRSINTTACLTALSRWITVTSKQIQPKREIMTFPPQFDPLPACSISVNRTIIHLVIQARHSGIIFFISYMKSINISYAFYLLNIANTHLLFYISTATILAISVFYGY